MCNNSWIELPASFFKNSLAVSLGLSHWVGISDLSHGVSLVSAPTGKCVENMIKKHKNPVFMSNRHILLKGDISKPLNQTLYAESKNLNLY